MSKNDKLPEGFTKRLEAGIRRKIQVERGQLNVKDGKPFGISSGLSYKNYSKVRVEGEMELVFDPADPVCGTDGSAYIVTEASILVG